MLVLCTVIWCPLHEREAICSRPHRAPSDLQAVIALQLEPEFRRYLDVAREPECSVGRDGTFASDNARNATHRDIDVTQTSQHLGDLWLA